MKLDFFFHRFSKIIQLQIYIKIRQVGAQLLHVDRQTDRHEKANSRFSQFWNTPKNEKNNTGRWKLGYTLKNLPVELLTCISSYNYATAGRVE